MATGNERLAIDNRSSQTPTSFSESVGSSLREKAQKLEKDRTIYGIYALWTDAISISSGVMKMAYDRSL